MSLIQAIKRAQRLQAETGRQHVVLAELKREHKPTYRVKDGLDWHRLAERSPRAAAAFEQVYPRLAP